LRDEAPADASAAAAALEIAPVRSRDDSRLPTLTNEEACALADAAASHSLLLGLRPPPPVLLLMSSRMDCTDE
jgi:hypothetical protein